MVTGLTAVKSTFLPQPRTYVRTYLRMSPTYADTRLGSDVGRLKGYCCCCVCFARLWFKIPRPGILNSLCRVYIPA